MAKHELHNENEKKQSKNESNKVFMDVEVLTDSFPPKNKSKYKSDKSFAEMVQEQTRLPEIKSSLPISMKEILHSTPKQTDWTPHLPALPPGQVQLVHRNDTKTNRKEKGRLKRERKSKFQGQRKHESLFSHRTALDEPNEAVSSWKTKLHPRQKKRLLDDGESSLTVGREFRLPTLREVTKW